MRHEYEAKVEELLADRVGASTEPLSSIQAVGIFDTIGRDLISVECGNVDAIADSVGAVLARVLKSIDIPMVPEFLEVQIEAFVVAWVVSQMKAYGHSRCVKHEE